MTDSLPAVMAKTILTFSEQMTDDELLAAAADFERQAVQAGPDTADGSWFSDMARLCRGYVKRRADENSATRGISLRRVVVGEERRE